MLPDGKELMWMAIGVAIGWFLIPMLMSRAGNKTAPGPAGY